MDNLSGLDQLANQRAILEVLQKLYCTVPVRKLPIETIIAETIQLFTSHGLKVHEALLVIKRIKKEIKRQSLCTMIVSENLTTPLQQQSEMDYQPDCYSDQIGQENKDPSM